MRYSGITIYKPKGAAEEYAKWACNLYNGCSNLCEYCYNRHCQAKALLGKGEPTTKRDWTEDKLFEQFKKEINKWKWQIIEDGGIHFNFVSDPCLPETYELNLDCIRYAVKCGVPVQILTKMSEWIDTLEWQSFLESELFKTNVLRVSFGFTLTGMDEMEPGASTNDERINAMQRLYKMGCTTWASIEPVIDVQRSIEMMRKSAIYCDTFKIGLLSGKKAYTRADVWGLKATAEEISRIYGSEVIFKKSVRDFLK